MFVRWLMVCMNAKLNFFFLQFVRCDAQKSPTKVIIYNHIGTPFNAHSVCKWMNGKWMKMCCKQLNEIWTCIRIYTLHLKWKTLKEQKTFNQTRMLIAHCSYNIHMYYICKFFLANHSLMSCKLAEWTEKKSLEFKCFN